MWPSSPSAWVCATEPRTSVNDDRPERGVGVRLARRVLGERAHERVQRDARVELDDRRRHRAVRLSVDLLDRFRDRPLGQAEHRPSVLVEPVRVVVDVERALLLEVLHMRGREVLRRDLHALVTIQVHRHAADCSAGPARAAVRAHAECSAALSSSGARPGCGRGRGCRATCRRRGRRSGWPGPSTTSKRPLAFSASKSIGSTTRQKWSRFSPVRGSAMRSMIESSSTRTDGKNRSPRRHSSTWIGSSPSSPT